MLCVLWSDSESLFLSGRGVSAVDRFSGLISPLNDRRPKLATRDGLVIPRARVCVQAR